MTHRIRRFIAEFWDFLTCDDPMTPLRLRDVPMYWRAAWRESRSAHCSSHTASKNKTDGA